MEIFELRYFLGVAKRENLQRAAEDLRVSAGSLSKAISRLEEETGVPLFSRHGRNIRLTDHGRVLMRRASEILQLEEAARLELKPGKATVHVSIAGAEVLLVRMGLEVAAKVRKRIIHASFELQTATESQAIARVQDGEVHLALIAGSVPKSLRGKVVGRSSFVTCVGNGHPLAARARSDKGIPIKEVLQHPFACPSLPLFGQVNQHQSLDGWRDDVFPRQVAFVSPSLRVLEELIVTGKAQGYLPDYHIETLKLTRLKVTGCPYSCEQDIKLIARDPERLAWMGWLF